jgi:hypothetical protein
MEDQVFTVKQGEWQVVVDGKVLPATFNSYGAAKAGMETEQRRAAYADFDCRR